MVGILQTDLLITESELFRSSCKNSVTFPKLPMKPATPVIIRQTAPTTDQPFNCAAFSLKFYLQVNNKLIT